MAHTALGIASVLILVGFIWFSFRQGLKVKPDPNNRDNGSQYGGIPPDGSHGGFGGPFGS